MQRRPLLLAVPLVLLYQITLAQEAPRGTASFEPPPALVENAPLTAQTFVIRAAIVNMMETDLADLALSRSQNEKVKAYARRMRDEHWRAQEKLRSVAGELQIALPGMADKKHEDIKVALKRAPADEFDAGYIKAIVSGHDDAVALFDAAVSSKALSRPLQSYASEMLPMIRKHRDAAYSLQSR